MREDHAGNDKSVRIAGKSSPTRASYDEIDEEVYSLPDSAIREIKEAGEKLGVMRFPNPVSREDLLTAVMGKYDEVKTLFASRIEQQIQKVKDLSARFSTELEQAEGQISVKKRRVVELEHELETLQNAGDSIARKESSRKMAAGLTAAIATIVTIIYYATLICTIFTSRDALPPGYKPMLLDPRMITIALDTNIYAFVFGVLLPLILVAAGYYLRALVSKMQALISIVLFLFDAGWAFLVVKKHNIMQSEADGRLIPDDIASNFQNHVLSVEFLLLVALGVLLYQFAGYFLSLATRDAQDEHREKIASLDRELRILRHEDKELSGLLEKITAAIQAIPGKLRELTEAKNRGITNIDHKPMLDQLDKAFRSGLQAGYSKASKATQQRAQDDLEKRLTELTVLKIEDKEASLPGGI